MKVGFHLAARFDLCAQQLKNTYTDFIQTWYAHAFGTGEEPYF